MLAGQLAYFNPLAEAVNSYYSIAVAIGVWG
jgi:hypothetical protein